MYRFLCLIETDDRMFCIKSALSRLKARYPRALGGCSFSPMEVRADKDRYAALMDAAGDCDFAVVYFHGGCQNLPGFDRFWARVTKRMPCFFVSSLPEEIAELMPSSRLQPEQYKSISGYFSRLSEENYFNMLLYIANVFFGMGDPAAPYDETPRAGLYLPGGILNAQEEKDYLTRAAAADKPVVGVLLHSSHVCTGNVRAADALINALERAGAFPLAVYSSLSSDPSDAQSGIRYALEKYFMPGGRRILKCIVVTTGFSITCTGYAGEAGGEFRTSVFEKWNVPVLQVMSTHYTREQYEEKLQGIDPMSLSVNVFQPEIDGRITTVPYAVSIPCGCGGVGRRMWEPLEERIGHIAKLAMNFVKLSAKRNSEKKVAILFHNMPGNHNIGRGAGLDTFESVHNVLRAMKQAGYTVDSPYANGQQIAESLLHALTNDTGWIPSEEAVRRAADRVPAERMRRWFEPLAPAVAGQLAEQWGEFPGEVMIEGGSLLIPGIVNGNIFIGLQPSRAFDKQAESLYHSAVFSPPYSYISYYRWIEEVFGADAIIHVGTHGSLEWLPGKEVGLSGNCYPDLCIGCVPNFYIYHIGITGEGIQAKRRSAADILDHLPPSMDDSGVYDRLADIDAALREYYAAKQSSAAQVKTLRKRIFELAEESRITGDLRITRGQYEAAPDECIGKIHLWTEELKNSVVTDGLHVFGEAPEGKLYENMLRMLVRVRSGNVPALNDAILTARGYDAQAVKDDPSAQIGGRAASDLYGEAVEAARAVVSELARASYSREAVGRIVQKEEFTGGRAPLESVLTFLCDTVRPRLDRTADELTNLIAALSGGFTEPGLGGNPTRGNAALLPTGRNFYAGDPSEIPSVGAWEIGRTLAKKSLEYYLSETGEYPESIAMVIWSGNVIKTCGEDFGEIFSLMGVRPVYLGATSKVIGVEAVPLSELGRPRIDVTLRISGLFRDMYPNLIQLMDEAVTCAAAQDEGEEENYIRKHINADILSLLDEGISGDAALDRAYVRVFGCPAGGYGAGVANLIGNRNWTDYQDIAKVYETWSGNAYGRNSHGAAMPELFKRRLSTVGMTIKNESTVEIDMLSSDDFFSYHGGLVACVRANSGKAPLSLTGHSDDPDRPVVRDTERETARILRSRILNPKWLKGLKRHGFKGAQEISKAVDSFFGWDASAGVAQDWMYESIARQFLFDSETREWIKEVNCGVLYNISGKLLEADKRGMWNADRETLDELRKIFLQTEGLLEEENG